jgi:hypothetical protein
MRVVVCLALVAVGLASCEDDQPVDNRCFTRRCLWSDQTQSFSRDCVVVYPEAGAGCDAAAPSQGECRGPGHYQSGKEGSYRPCCAGLTEVFHQYPAYGENRTPICTDVPLRVYACVAGVCGDGICEAGEAVACGCVSDCPQAQWGAPDAGAGRAAAAAP